MEKLTIVTPTYNRAYLLKNCYDSLCAQICRDFRWMIVDDGSTDDTEAIVLAWQAEGIIPMQYLKKANGGKASALNLAIDRLETEYAVCLDSDDTFYPNAVELACAQLDEVRTETDCCGLLALRNNPDGSVMGKREIPVSMQYVTAMDIFLKLRLRTELICFYKAEVLRQFRFPEFPGEKFVSPAWMQYAVTQEYRYKTSWDRLCRCEYVADGLTKNKRKVIAKNPRGYSCVKRWSFDLAPSAKLRVKHGIMYDCGCILAKDRDWLKNVKHKGWAVLLYPAGWFVYWKRFRNLGR